MESVSTVANSKIREWCATVYQRFIYGHIRVRGSQRQRNRNIETYSTYYVTRCNSHNMQ
jgi:hypothetical protein